VPVVRPACVETTALGAACLAGLAVGCWPDRAAIARDRTGAAIFSPARDRAAIDALRQGWSRAVECSKNWARPA